MTYKQLKEVARPSRSGPESIEREPVDRLAACPTTAKMCLFTGRSKINASIFLFLLMVGFSAGLALGQASALIRGGKVIAEKGQVVELPIFLQCPEGIRVAALQFDLVFDPQQMDILAIKPGESIVRAEKQLVSRKLASQDAEPFRGNASPPQYLDMRKKPPGSAAPPSPDGKGGAVSGRERVVVAGLNSRAIDTGLVALVTIRVHNSQDIPSLSLNLAGVSMAGPDAKAVAVKVEAGQIVLEKNQKNLSKEK